MKTVHIPAQGWRVRPYQEAFWDAMTVGGMDRAAVAWHRRAGKDEIALNLELVHSQAWRVGNYVHMLPLANQCRKAMWDAINPHTGRRRIDEVFPKEIIQDRRESDMFIRFKNGATWQLMGSDNFASVIGAGLLMVTFSEWAKGDPRAWPYIRPMLDENGGKAVFISTFEGENHHHRMVNYAIESEKWFGQILGADKTGIFTAEQLAEIKAELIQTIGDEEEATAIFEQEYFCSVTPVIKGAYFGKQIREAESQGRICPCPYDPTAPVYTYWDLGLNDSTSIWFWQKVGRESRFIDYLEENNKDIYFYADTLKDRGYRYECHVLPHDGGRRQYGVKGGLTIKQQLEEQGLKNVKVAKRFANESEKLAAINEARRLIARSVFDSKRTDRGIDALRHYRREWDEDKKTFHDKPYHDWASHGADAFLNAASFLNAIPKTDDRVRSESWLNAGMN